MSSVNSSRLKPAKPFLRDRWRVLDSWYPNGEGRGILDTTTTGPGHALVRYIPDSEHIGDAVQVVQVFDDAAHHVVGARSKAATRYHRGAHLGRREEQVLPGTGANIRRNGRALATVNRCAVGAVHDALEHQVGVVDDVGVGSSLCDGVRRGPSQVRVWRVSRWRWERSLELRYAEYAHLAEQGAAPSTHGAARVTHGNDTTQEARASHAAHPVATASGTTSSRPSSSPAPRPCGAWAP